MEIDEKPTAVIKKETASSGEKSKKPKKNKSIYSFDEINELMDTESRYKSNMFRLSMEMCLQQISVSESEQDNLTGFLKGMKEYLQKPKKSFEKREMKDFLFPVESHLETFRYVAPEAFHLVGSYLLKTVAKPVLNLDVAMEFPEGTFKDKDYLNFRYFNKRYFLLSVIGEQLEAWEQGGDVKISWQFMEKNRFKPCLVIEKKDFKNDWKIRLFPCLSLGNFSPNRLAPQRNALRPALLKQLKEMKNNNLGAPALAAFEKYGADAEDPSKASNLLSTAYYNNSILSDMLYTYHLKFLYVFFNGEEANEELVNALKLLKTWSRQRNFYESDGLNGFVISMILVYLLQKKRVSKEMSAYQIIRIFMTFLAKELADNSFVWRIASPEGTDEKIMETFSDEAFKSNFHATLIDPSGMVNIFAGFSVGFCDSVRMEAIQSCVYFDYPEEIGFESLFLKQVEPALKFDISAHVPNVCDAMDSCDRVILDFLMMGDCIPAGAKKLETILRKALGNRVQYLYVSICNDSSPLPFDRKMKAKSLVEQELSDCRYRVCLILNSAESYRVIDKGPELEAEAAILEFRRFWGEKSELRRFEDATIREAVVWSSIPQVQIVPEIMKFVVGRHVSESVRDSIAIWSSPYDKVISGLSEHVTDESNNLNESSIQTCFKSLCAQMKQLEKIPLYINQITGLCPSLRFTSYAPFSATVDQLKNLNQQKAERIMSSRDENGIVEPCVPVHEALLHFETTNKWPDDLEAIQTLKLALLHHLSVELGSQLMLKSVVNALGHLDVHKQGHVFRFTIWHETELKFLERSMQQSNNKLSSKIPNAASNLPCMKKAISEVSEVDKAILHSHWRARYIAQARVSELCRQIYVKRPVAFRYAVMYIKHWLYHMMAEEGPNSVVIFERLLDFLGVTNMPTLEKEDWFLASASGWSFFEDRVDLLICRLFLVSAPFPVPGSGMVAFHRFLDLVAKWDSRLGPLFVPTLFEEGLKIEQSAEDPANMEIILCPCHPENKESFNQAKEVANSHSKEMIIYFGGLMMRGSLGEVAEEGEKGEFASLYSIGRKFIKVEHDDKLILGRKRCREGDDSDFEDSTLSPIRCFIKPTALDPNDQKLRWKRLQYLASVSLQHIKNLYSCCTRDNDGDAADFFRVFSVNLSDFDLVLELNERFLTKSPESCLSALKSSVLRGDQFKVAYEAQEEAPISALESPTLPWIQKLNLELDTLQGIVSRLELKLGAYAQFYYNPMGSPFIGVAWKRSSLPLGAPAKSQYKPSMTYPVINDGQQQRQLVPNLACLWQQMIRTVGSSVIRRIYEKK